MRNIVKTLGLVLLITATQAGNSALAAKQDALLPLLKSDVPAVCGCSFVRTTTRGEMPFLHWASGGQQQAIVRTEGTRHVLSLRQEKRMPVREGKPRPNDRWILFVANGDWQIQYLGTAVASKCDAKRQCSERYQGRLLVQQDGGARNEIIADATCVCPQ